MPRFANGWHLANCGSTIKLLVNLPCVRSRLHAMASPLSDDVAVTPARRRMRVRVARAALIFLLAYFAIAYLTIPILTSRYYKRHPMFDDNPRITTTSDGHPGDPLNVAIIGTKEQVETIMKAAKWYPASALGLRSDLAIAADSVLSRPDDEAPVSNLYLYGRREDLAFEQPVGDNPRQRHHVRFWKIDGTDVDGRPVWIGSASYDERVGLSHTTGQITHHIDGDVDKERDHLFADLKQTGELEDDYAVDGFHAEREGRNGGGDRWFTNGKLDVAVVAENAR